MGDLDDRLDAVADFFYPHAPERVWNVLVDPDAMGDWFVEQVGFRAVEGMRFRLTDLPMPIANYSGDIACEVLVAIRNEMLAISWWDTKSSDPVAWRTAWTLCEVPGGTVVTVSRPAFSSDDPAVRRMAALSDRFWPTAMAKLGRLIDRAATTPVDGGSVEL
ncbi:Activator of Hsp90 ATPase homolog 1-like protein [Mycolicibacterium phlei]|uniref:SRPBCC family protein n=1 Tax=Mycobacteroides chelonae TaxID=1774 RepID=UPI000B32C988|nr:SRPBCC domain-containing protein [Mycobacteroides chelonae]VEG20182.1 Activator of Hsp90 ATPase homolog 1-like protein [Mycolicibacterium phlei]